MEAVDMPRVVSFKGATDLVTDTDRASEDAVLRVLRDAFPGHAILGEEGGISGDTGSEYLWCGARGSCLSSSSTPVEWQHRSAVQRCSCAFPFALAQSTPCCTGSPRSASP